MNTINTTEAMNTMMTALHRAAGALLLGVALAPTASAATVYTGDVIQGKRVISQLDVADLEPGKVHKFYFQGVQMALADMKTELESTRAFLEHMAWRIGQGEYRRTYFSHRADLLLTLIEHLRRHFAKQIPAVILSGDTSQAAAAAIQEADIPLLHKPVRPAKLRALLQRKTQV